MYYSFDSGDMERQNAIEMVKFGIEDMEWLVERSADDDPIQNFTKNFAPEFLDYILDTLGYERTDFDMSGWEANYLVTYEKEGHRPLLMNACGWDGSIYLSFKD